MHKLRTRVDRHRVLAVPWRSGPLLASNNETARLPSPRQPLNARRASTAQRIRRPRRRRQHQRPDSGTPLYAGTTARCVEPATPPAPQQTAGRDRRQRQPRHRLPEPHCQRHPQRACTAITGSRCRDTGAATARVRRRRRRELRRPPKPVPAPAPAPEPAAAPPASVSLHRHREPLRHRNRHHRSNTAATDAGGAQRRRIRRRRDSPCDSDLQAGDRNEGHRAVPLGAARPDRAPRKRS